MSAAKSIVTRVLVLRFMRATGWKLLDIPSGFRLVSPRGRSLKWLIRDPVDDLVSYAINQDGLGHEYELVARLGLCVAAEELFEQRRIMEANGAHHLALGVLATEAGRLLLRAGIDPERWEASR